MSRLCHAGDEIMPSDFLADRKAGLENAFFAKQDLELRRRMAENDAKQARKAALVEVSGIRDEATLDRLLTLNITSETLAVMSLVPLVAVAWADGTLESKERSAILRAAEEGGLSKDSPSYALLDGWLAKKPQADLIVAWKEYISSWLSELDGAARATLRTEIVGRARSVAEAAGGFLSLTARISDAEQRVLHELEAAFQAPPDAAA